MIPAGNVYLDQEELIDLVIGGIPETDLRKQARMHSFRSPFDMLKAFSMITLRDTRSDRDKRDNRKPLEQCSPANQARHSSELRCFNCNGIGQSQKDCPHPRREWGTCYKCGDPLHRSATCPQSAKTWIISATQIRGITDKKRTIENLVQPVAPDTTIVVPSIFPGPALDAESNTTYYVISAT